MGSGTLVRGRAWIVVIGCVLLAMLAAVPPTANAAFPGQNGKIVVQRTAGALEVINPDGSGASPLGISGSWPEWSPDGTKLAFTRGDGCG